MEKILSPGLSHAGRKIVISINDDGSISADLLGKSSLCWWVAKTGSLSGGGGWSRQVGCKWIVRHDILCCCCYPTVVREEAVAKDETHG